jgi:hypothetical protein
MKSNFTKARLTLVLIAFGFSLQSFIGVRIEKRHYRKGYYVHIWHNPKTQPVHAASEKPVAKEVKQTAARVHAPVAQAPQSIDKPQRTAPTSRAD